MNSRQPGWRWRNGAVTLDTNRIIQPRLRRHGAGRWQSASWKRITVVTGFHSPFRANGVPAELRERPPAAVIGGGAMLGNRLGVTQARRSRTN
jgi:hypothetical protein